MPTETPIAPTAPVTPAAPASSPGLDSGGKGIAGLMNAMENADVQPSDAPKTIKKDAPTAPKDAPKPADKSDDDGGDLDLDKADRTKTIAPKKFWRAYDKYKETQSGKLKELTDKLAKLEAKPVTTAADAQKIAQFEAQIKQLTTDRERLTKERGEFESKLASMDFTQSAEYEKKYVQPYEKAYKDGAEFVAQLTVNDGDGERAATKADFDMLRKMPVAARMVAARKMFGEYGSDVVSLIRDMDRISAAASAEVNERSKNYENEKRESASKAEREAAEYQGLYQSALSGLREDEKYGRWFSPDKDDPDFTRILSESEAELTGFREKMNGQLPPSEHAGMAASVFLKAAGFDGAIHRNEKLAAKLKALEEELAKFRKADPGADVKGANGKSLPADAPIGGIAGAAAQAAQNIGGFGRGSDVKTFLG